MNLLRRQRNKCILFLARAVMRKYGPGIIAVAGGIGKTSAAHAIYAILRELRHVRATNPDFPPLLKTPLAILGNFAYGEGFFFWIKALWAGIFLLIKNQPYPEMLIIEYDSDPRLIEHLLGFVSPQIAIITGTQGMPPEILRPIIAAVPSNGYCILKHDDPACETLQEFTRAHTLAFGFNEGARMRITNLECRTEGEAQKPVGMRFTLECEGGAVPVRLEGAFGKAPASAVAAAACVGMAFGMNLVRIAEAAHYHRTPTRCMQLMPGKKGIYMFNDTANALLISLQEALDTLEMLPARRTIAVVGTMELLDAHEEKLYEALLRRASKTCAVLMLIGQGRQIDKKNSMRFDTAERGAAELQTIIERGDIILIKGIGTEPIVDSLRSHRLVA